MSLVQCDKCGIRHNGEHNTCDFCLETDKVFSFKDTGEEFKVKVASFYIKNKNDDVVAWVTLDDDNITFEKELSLGELKLCLKIIEQKMKEYKR